MRKVLIFAAVAEATTGLALLMVPPFVGLLLLGEEFTGAGIVSGRVAGIALIALVLLCHKMVESKLLAAGTPDEVARQCGCDDDAYGCD